VTGWKNKHKIMQQYDASAPMYEGLYGEEQKAKYETALRNVKIAGRTILDAGCGSGLFFGEVARQASMVVGVDISRQLLCKANVQAKGFGNVFVLQADADHLPFLESTFDAIFAFTVLQNMPKPTETLKELKKVLKEEGEAVVTALKKAFTVPAFMDLLDATGFVAVLFVDDEALKCYVLVAKRLASAT
jgi:ubiquinone/menaquinone biosynthesis C-methylase UbiE